MSFSEAVIYTENQPTPKLVSCLNNPIGQMRYTLNATSIVAKVSYPFNLLFFFYIDELLSCRNALALHYVQILNTLEPNLIRIHPLWDC